MQPLYHPPVSEMTVQGVLYALSDPVRVSIVADLAAAECPKTCCSYAGAGKRKLPKSTLSQHFRILREAGLIRSERVGVAMHNRMRYDELKGTSIGKLVETIIEAYSAQCTKASSRK